MNKICGLDQVDTLVTDSNVESFVVEGLRDNNVEVIQVKA